IDTEDQNFERFNEETGFDPRRDLQSFVFASPASSNGGAESRFAILARGTFDQPRMEAAAKARGATVQNYEGVDLILDKSSNQKTGFAFPDVGVAVMADVTTLREIIANRAASTALDPTLQEMMSKTGSDNDAWFVCLTGGSYLSRHLNHETKQPMQQAQALESVLRSSGGIRFGSVVELSFDAVTRSPKDATSLTDVIRFLSSLVQMQRQNDPRADILASSLDQMSLTTNGDAMHVSISLPEKTLEQLADSGPRASTGRTHR
ncbi:MAG: hypothetical protein WB992_01445, partial [Bryobacteraceae bacterium]